MIDGYSGAVVALRFHPTRLGKHSCFPHATIRTSTATYSVPAQDLEGAESEGLYRYTSGRWLWAEEERLRERYRRFNVAGLKRLAAEARGTQSCSSIIKLAEGGFNKVFRLSMDTGAVVIARLPNPNVGPISASRVIASEVATMAFARNVLGIPVPDVLAWDADNSNSAHTEYILMDEAEGTQLGELWSGMDLDDKLKIVDDVIAMQDKLQSVTFSKSRSSFRAEVLDYRRQDRYGNLYFKSDAPQGCVPVEVSGHLSHSAKTYAEDQFPIGPVAEEKFWQAGTASLLTDRGPWPNAQSYLLAIAQRERLKMPSTEASANSGASQHGSTNLDPRHTRLSLLEKFEAVSPYLPPRDPNLNRASLSYWDFRAPNIFVENGRIPSRIDWQDTWVGPLFTQRYPQLIEHRGEMLLRLPDYYETMEDKEEKAKVTEQVEGSIWHWDYGREIRKKSPPLDKMFNRPVGRECSSQLQRCWDQLETGVTCPIGFTAEEIEAERADFWSSLDGFVSRDGHTSVHDYEQAREMFEALREEGLALFSGTELAEFAEQSRWARRTG